MALQPGQVLAVTGAAGSFGGYVVQLAKAEGLTVVADASEADEDLVRELGADVVVRRGDDVAARIRERYPDGVDGLADGSVQDAAVLPAVKDGGVVTTVRGYRGDGQRDATVRRCWCAGTRRRPRRWTGSASRWRRASSRCGWRRPSPPPRRRRRTAGSRPAASAAASVLTLLSGPCAGARRELASGGSSF